MLDRVPLYPGRVKLTPVSGQENVYDMVRADQPTQEGTPLNKASLLTDATAALFGLGTDAVPDDMLNALAHTGDLHVWKRTQNGQVDYPVSPNRNAYQEGSDKQPAGYTLGEVQSGQFKLTTDSDLYSPSILYTYGSSVYVSEDGSLSLFSPDGSVSATREQYEYDRLPVLKGKFIQANTPGSGNWIGDFQVGEIFFIPETATLNKLSNGTPFFSQIQAVTGYAAIPANNTIMYVGQLGERARFVTGSYVGTGQYGQSNPNTLEFPFEPKFFWIYQIQNPNAMVADIGLQNQNFLGMVPWVTGKTLSTYLYGASDQSIFTFTKTTVSWYVNTTYDRSDQQLNSSGYTYFYLALA